MWIFGYGSLVWKADFPYVKKIVGFVKGYERKFWQAIIDHRGVPEKPGRVVTLVPAKDPDTRVWGTAYKIHRRDVDYVVKHLDLKERGGYEKVPETFHPIPNHRMNYEVDSDSLTSSYSSGSSEGEDPIHIDQCSDSDSGHGSPISTDNDASKSDPNSDIDSDEEIESYENIKFGRPIRVTMYFGSDTNEHFMGPAPLEEIAAQIFECSGYSGRNRDYLYNLAETMREICDEALDSHLGNLESAVRDLERRKEKGERAVEGLQDVIISQSLSL